MKNLKFNGIKTKGGKQMKEQYVMKKSMRDKIKKFMTITELAERVGVTRCYMSEVVNRRRKSIGKSLAILIAREFNTSVEDIFDVVVK